LALFPVFGIGDAKVVAVSYGHDFIWLFFGGFQLAFAVEASGLHRRIALFLVRLVGTRADRLVLGFMLASGLLSMWLLNTSTTLMMLPVAMAVGKAVEPEGDGPFGRALMLGLAYAASVGGMGTYVGTAPNGVFGGIARDRGFELSFAEWMQFAAPLSVLLIFMIWFYLVKTIRVPKTDLAEDHPAKLALAERMGPWTTAEKRVAMVFVATVAAWILRKPVVGWLDLPPKAISDATIAVAAAISLYLVRADGAPLLTWTVSKRTPWHILLLFGGGFALAGGFKATGLSAFLGGGLATAVDGMPIFVVVLSVVLLVTFLTEVTSNTATANVLLPIIADLAISMGLAPTMLMLPATLACSCAFMLPVATPPNAIVYGSQMFRMGHMVRAGIWLNIGTAVVITVWTLTWGTWLFDW
jgi:sodium-dependent dicarboxylate transporter 2/3/5